MRACFTRRRAPFHAISFILLSFAIFHYYCHFFDTSFISFSSLSAATPLVGLLTGFRYTDEHDA